MDNFFSRYKNPLVLVAVLSVQVIALATQVKRAANPKEPNAAETPLIRVWVVNAITPVERVLVSTGHFFRNTWHNYIDLHDVRKQNQALQDEITRLKIEQTRLKEDAEQAHRLQGLLQFKQHYVGDVLPAQVIGSSGSQHSRLIYIDKGEQSGLRPDMAVITPDGIVGKVKDVTRYSATVLLINDRESGAGVVLEKSRRQGVLRGAANGELNLRDIMSDEKIDLGEQVITSGGDRIYPKGVPVGTVSGINPDREDGYSLAIKIKPAVDLDRLEEVLVVKTAEQAPPSTGPAPQRAADILAERLPSIPKVDPNAPKAPTGNAAAAGQNAGPIAAGPKKPEAAAGEPKKPAAPGAADQNKPVADQKKSALPGAPPATHAASATPGGAASGQTNPTANLKKPAASASDTSLAGVSAKKPSAEQKQGTGVAAEQKKASAEQQKKAPTPGPSPNKSAGADNPATSNASAANPKPVPKAPKATVVQTTTGNPEQKPKPAVQTTRPAQPNRPPVTTPGPSQTPQPQAPPPAESSTERPPQ
jgi:rod shape-determining protein MreC